jgi:hypothetical protein
MRQAACAATCPEKIRFEKIALVGAGLDQVAGAADGRVDRLAGDRGLLELAQRRERHAGERQDGPLEVVAAVACVAPRPKVPGPPPQT